MTKELVDYVMQFGGRCRDCADDGPICPSNGLPCGSKEARQGVGHVIKALAFGIKHGYLSNPFPLASEPIRQEPADPTPETNLVVEVGAFLDKIEVFGRDLYNIGDERTYRSSIEPGLEKLREALAATTEGRADA